LTFGPLRAPIAAALFLVGVLAIGASAQARPCSTADSQSIVVANSLGDVYNQVASDGNEEFPSFFARGTLIRKGYALTIQTHRSEYQTEHTGDQTDTVIHTLAGPDVAVPWFLAIEETDEARIARCIGFFDLYAGIGFLQTSSNLDYPIGYRRIRGGGVGIERSVNPERRLDVFTALYYYPAAQGAYGARTLTFTAVTFDGGVSWRLGSSSSALVFGLYQEMRSLHPGSRAAQTVRSAPYIGLQLAGR